VLIQGGKKGAIASGMLSKAEPQRWCRLHCQRMSRFKCFDFIFHSACHTLKHPDTQILHTHTHSQQLPGEPKVKDFVLGQRLLAQFNHKLLTDKAIIRCCCCNEFVFVFPSLCAYVAHVKMCNTQFSPHNIPFHTP